MVHVHVPRLSCGYRTTSREGWKFLRPLDTQLSYDLVSPPEENTAAAVRSHVEGNGTTSSVGLALEVFLSLLTPRFFPFLLVTLIICNLSSVIVPVPLMHKFYRFAYAMPFYQNVQATKVILFETERRNALARYFGVLGAWVVLMLGLLVGAQWMEQKRVRPRGVQSSAHDERHEQESSDDAEDKVSDAEDKADSADEKQDYDEEATTPVE